MATYRDLQAQLRQHQAKGIDIQVSLKADHNTLEAELERVESLPQEPAFKADSRDVVSFNQAYAQGLKDEEMVIAWLKSKGYKVEPSTKEENILQDIDCYIDGVPTSIKAQHAGVKYGNIYMELKAQLTSGKQWVSSWFENGKAEQYLILQGKTLRLYKKADLAKHVAEIGWSHTRTLSAQVKATQGGTYRFSNALLGFLKPSDVTHKLWCIQDDTEA